MFGILTQNRNWYTIDNVSYSANLRYFKEHQLELIREDKILTFKSKIEDKVFLVLNINDLPSRFEDLNEHDMIAEVHKRLLKGDFGEGDFTN